MADKEDVVQEEVKDESMEVKEEEEKKEEEKKEEEGKEESKEEESGKEAEKEEPKDKEEAKVEVEKEEVEEKEVEKEVEKESPKDKEEVEEKQGGNDLEVCPGEKAEPAIYLSPKWADLPPQWNSVKGVSVCADKNKRFRRSMEDAHLCIDNFCNNTSNGYFAIYDGHGGRNCVEYVEKHLHHLLSKMIEGGKPVPESLKQSYLDVDDEIHENEIKYSGTTAVSCCIMQEEDKKMLYVANCGDARAVLCRGGKAIRLTVDHKANDEEEAARIRNAGGFILMNRVNGILAVTRSLGDQTMKEFVTGEPYLNQIQLTAEDSHLIVACDGVWDVLEDQDACNIVMKEKDLKKKAERLVGHSLKGGSTDNISVIVIVL
uniref:PPM-type phosphatase domain-containing protein n=1 Tax=Paramoeba aestuarina TaxID=180227 RepID=A0A6U2VV92_9EUKA|mmetsp:Transcript_12309/g.18783  ORF Transcript_12309/g.18783 Transcript_12309/m.18783 type:complete len:374 (+) Transcript_12309:236-1357(+)|eukprot:CAMPEP_0201522544 /NCGR_PEP_ID=MMETSP0161_2-20130828/18007_1 /ASSEMBLY_ACC=CAM_ASM_000251 /TAXON_ID=180227 /ORGANISM="Neoparamoeba aestuarina, Strain SoJaBio B1-5/56/2" /LENGTH=373 /DNA_ID=CAMNT_0047921423 /DNA_START=75 /DNA_END=1196 /DNA_ORIENTATION=+